MLSELIPRAAARHGERTALVANGTALSYAGLDRSSDRVAGALAGMGVGPGEVVSLYAPNSWQWVVAYYGILKAGAVVNPLNAMLTTAEVDFAVRDSGARAIVAAADKLDAVLGIRAGAPDLEFVVSTGDAPDGVVALDEVLATDRRRPDVPPPSRSSPGVIAYTSGTTGRPKGARLSQYAVFLDCALTATMHLRTAADVMVTALPVAHGFGAVIMSSIFLAGGTVVLLERFDPGAVLETISRERATLFEGVPAMYSLMLADPDLGRHDLSSLTRCTVGGQAMPAAVTKAWEERTGAPLVELWGMTEASGIGTTHPHYAPNRSGSVGVPLPGVRVQVASDADPDRPAPPGEPGELLVAGPTVMLGYHRAPEATAETIDGDGWLHTGDIAVADHDGYLTIVDRKKDMIITGGYNVYPAEIERIVATHPAVALVAVGSRPDEVKGELACAYVVLKPGAQAAAADILDHCRPHLAPYKRPRAVVFVDDLPRTSTGKVLRRDLHRLG